jgi:hypothetical protein
VTIAAALAGVILLVVAAAALTWTARLVRIGNLDMQALADKLGTPEPLSALDWPELRLQAVVAQPDDQPLVLLSVGWPARTPPQLATLLIALDGDDQRSLAVLSRWCAGEASVSPVRQAGAGLELRRRQSLERVHAVLVAEDITPVSCD